MYETHESCAGRAPSRRADPRKRREDVLPSGHEGHGGLFAAPPGRTDLRACGLRFVGRGPFRDERRRRGDGPATPVDGHVSGGHLRLDRGLQEAEPL